MKYPRIWNKWECNPQGLCIFCEQPKSDMRVSVQVNWFRGDDIVLKVHKKCIRNLRDEQILKGIQNVK
jgi:hypothetical protein